VVKSLVALCMALALLIGSAADASKPGTLDTTFGLNGKVITDFGQMDGIEDIAVQPNGKIVAAGSSSDRNTGESRFALARYTKNGALDPTFGTGGKLTTDFGRTIGGATSVALQPDGKIVVAGGVGGSPTGVDIALARYDPSGSLDPTFGSGGKVVTDLRASHEAALAIVLEQDGKVVVAGYTRPFGSYADFVLARYTPTGALDQSFGRGGSVSTDFQQDWTDMAEGVAFGPGGKIVAAGTGRPDDSGGPGVIDVARYEANGNLDSSFDGDGILISRPSAGDNGAPGGVVVQPDGKVIVAGFVDFGMALVRYTVRGALDDTFGLARGGVATAHGYANDLLRQPDGKLVAVGPRGVSETDLNLNFSVARFTRSGLVDPSFHGGETMTDLGGWDLPEAVALQRDGKIVIAGERGQIVNGFIEAEDFALARFVGQGPRCHVPRLVGMTRRAAKAAITRANCRLGRVGRKASARPRAGRVLSQHPAPGAYLPNGSRIDLVVSRGRS
jgi:uncharacterized delta-60 repeat protein